VSWTQRLGTERGYNSFKNTAVHYKETLINIVDTLVTLTLVSGVLGMVDGCILIVDANEGPMPRRDLC